METHVQRERKCSVEECDGKEGSRSRLDGIGHSNERSGDRCVKVARKVVSKDQTDNGEPFLQRVGRAWSHHGWLSDLWISCGGGGGRCLRCDGSDFCCSKHPLEQLELQHVHHCNFRSLLILSGPILAINIEQPIFCDRTHLQPSLFNVCLCFWNVTICSLLCLWHFKKKRTPASPPCCGCAKV